MPAHPYIRFAHELMERVQTDDAYGRRFRRELADAGRHAGALEASCFQGLADLGGNFTETLAGLLAASLGVGWRGRVEGLEVRRAVVSPSLFEALLDTEPPSAESIDEDSLHLPVGGLVVRWPDGRETYLMSDERANAVLEIVQSSRPVQIHDNQGKLLGTRIQLPPGIVWWYDVCPADLVRRATYFGSIRSVLGNLQEGPDEQPSIPREMAGEMARISRLVLNLLLYINSDDAEPDGEQTVFPKKKAVIADNTAFNPNRFHNYWHLGVREAYVRPSGAGASNGDDGYVIDYRYFRRGHWRSQPVGPGRIARKRKWIKPHWVGPEDGRVLNRVSALEP